jgi:hypothetical protein
MLGLLFYTPFLGLPYPPVTLFGGFPAGMSVVSAPQFKTPPNN